jgi:transposase-like protein
MKKRELNSCNGQLARSVAQALGISKNLLHQWKRAARANHSSAETFF